MMMLVSIRRIFSILLFIGVLFKCYGQQNQYKIANNAIFRDLSIAKSEYIRIYCSNPDLSKILPIEAYPYKTFPQNIIFSKGYLYIFLTSSGIVYQSNKYDSKDDHIYFSRLDSTTLFKYNINCYNFVYKDSIFNIGGYGFWRWNGHLRVYNYKFKEWDIIPLNKELPIENDDKIPSIWFSPKSNKFISLFYIYGNDGIENEKGINKQTIDSVVELNLSTKKWTTIGSLHPTLKHVLLKSNKITDLDSGILINNEGEIAYLNFVDNTVRKTVNKKYTFFFNSKIGYYPVIWYRNNFVFFSKNFDDSNIDSIKINLADFTETLSPIYIRQPYITFNYIYLMIGIIIFIALILFLSKYFHKKPFGNKYISNNNIKNSNETEVFTLIEKLLISNIINNQIELGKKTSVYEVNKILGISNKSIDVQKRKRSDTISSINEKFVLIVNINEYKLIKRARTDFDKRIYDFYISEEDIRVIENYIH
jgi:hypothetical protein